ncbi:MAG: DNA-processing protein DprA, partial [Clostridia bacterium]|nr:DNA-processing protein DprA [Clostridia bacterium]
IDCTAQKGAIVADGSTVAVLGSGIDVLYPYQNKDTFIRILEKGAIVTEYPPHTPPNGYNFPVRNRLISGMSKGLVVVEGDRNSGAMITADKAIKQGRPLFAVPGQPGVFQATGTNELIRNGTKAVSCAIDVLEEYLDEYGDKINITQSKEKPDLSLLKKYDDGENKGFIKNFLEAIGFKNKNSQKSSKKSKIEKSSDDKEKSTNNIATEKTIVNLEDLGLTLDENAKKLYASMELGEKYSMDDFTDLGIETKEVSTNLTLLEMIKLVEKQPGGFYVRIK